MERSTGVTPAWAFDAQLDLEAVFADAPEGAEKHGGARALLAMVQGNTIRTAVIGLPNAVLLAWVGAFRGWDATAGATPGTHVLSMLPFCLGTFLCMLFVRIAAGTAATTGTAGP